MTIKIRVSAGDNASQLRVVTLLPRIVSRRDSAACFAKSLYGRLIAAN